MAKIFVIWNMAKLILATKDGKHGNPTESL